MAWNIPKSLTISIRDLVCFGLGMLAMWSLAMLAMWALAQAF